MTRNPDQRGGFPQGYEFEARGKTYITETTNVIAASLPALLHVATDLGGTTLDLATKLRRKRIQKEKWGQVTRMEQLTKIIDSSQEMLVMHELYSDWMNSGNLISAGLILKDIAQRDEFRGKWEGDFVEQTGGPFIGYPVQIKNMKEIEELGILLNIDKARSAGLSFCNLAFVRFE
ncbi:hypothetical protein HYW54_04560 [Candidatus Gottesmanbacteria bacterium]|nr:hypothetical protein [Candidatus Gottesmanbacteria bacterium]